MTQQHPSEDKRLFLLDAFALIYRAFFAFGAKPMVNSKGLKTSAIFGFTIMKSLNSAHRNEKEHLLLKKTDLIVERSLWSFYMCGIGE